jgi:hypothetical protein
MGDVTGRGRAVGRPLLRVVGGVDRLDAVASESFLVRVFFSAVWRGGRGAAVVRSIMGEVLLIIATVIVLLFPSSPSNELGMTRGGVEEGVSAGGVRKLTMDVWLLLCLILCLICAGSGVVGGGGSGGGVGGGRGVDIVAREEKFRSSVRDKKIGTTTHYYSPTASLLEVCPSEPYSFCEAVAM